jgi:hypothetical protein
MRYNAIVKTASIPSVRVEPELRAEVESLLGEGETVSEFVEASVRASVMRRRYQAEFIAKGLQSLDDAHRSGIYVEAGAVVRKLERRLDAARRRKAASSR